VRLVRVMLKDLRLIARDRSALASMLLVPMVVIVVVAETTGGSGTKSILVPVVNEDQGPVANVLIKTLREHLDVQEVDRPTAERLVAVENKAPAMLVMPAGMSKRYLTEKASTIELLTDPAKWTELQAIKVVFLLADREAASLGDPFSENLLEIKERSLTGSKMELSHLEQNLPGFSVMFVLLSLVFSVAFGLRDEETWGTSGRLSIAPVSQATILGGKLLARLVVGTAQLLILLVFAHFVYGMTLGHSPVSLFLVAAVIVFSMACFAVIVAALARTREQIIPVGMSAVFMLAALGGCWWPVYDQPKWMQAIGQFVMTTYSMFAIQDIMFRDKNLLQIGTTVMLLVAYGIVSFFVGLRFFRYTEN
jgi:linearmycin/streptolysin S transport system permease protein